jgi:hypothetical protein
MAYGVKKYKEIRVLKYDKNAPKNQIPDKIVENPML